MNAKYTTKELREFSDNRMIVCILSERILALPSSSLLSKRLQIIREKIQDFINAEDRAFERLRAISELDPAESPLLERLLKSCKETRFVVSSNQTLHYLRGEPWFKRLDAIIEKSHKHNQD